MYVYRELEKGLWTVGYFRPDGQWNPESDHLSPFAAAARVAWLNGGQNLEECKDRPVVEREEKS